MQTELQAGIDRNIKRNLGVFSVPAYLSKGDSYDKYGPGGFANQPQLSPGASAALVRYPSCFLPVIVTTVLTTVAVARAVLALSVGRVPPFASTRAAIVLQASLRWVALGRAVPASGLAT